MQGGRYAVALQQVLTQQGVTKPETEVVFVLGSRPRVTAKVPMDDDDYIDSCLDQIDGRIVYYDELIENALKQYEEYLQASASAQRLDDLLASLDDEGPDGGRSSAGSEVNDSPTDRESELPS